MSHNIETFRDIIGDRFSGGHAGEVLNNSVLTVRDKGDNVARMLFRAVPGIEGGKPALVLNPWPTSGGENGVTMGDRVIAIEGEDLYAFRELLDELPESAFKRPAEPVKKADPWVEGDEVYGENNDGANAWIYVRGAEEWKPGRALTKSASHCTMGMSDEQMDRYLAGGPNVHDNFTVLRRGGKAVQS